ncbi:beta-hydroxyacyl-ACP dehydratase [Artemisia annua]|uniref:Beta-hydroxyacyl-ACP dehydratase n=1 Tax=Artemisia annua TaxID=35608 RepID=A0A2U1N3R4_ARTAN|nr:beta-hydroxyacyl-ACP dehydratase [Artemisia annua]
MPKLVLSGCEKYWKNSKLLNTGCGLQAMAQVGGLIMLTPEVGGSKDNFFFAGIDKVRFRKPVIAGDTLVMRMNLTKLQKRFGIAKMEGKAYVGGEVVCEGEFLMAMGNSDS